MVRRVPERRQGREVTLASGLLHCCCCYAGALRRRVSLLRRLLLRTILQIQILKPKKTMSILPESWHGLLDLQLWPFGHPTDSSFMCHDKDPLTISREQITLPSPHCLLFLNLDVQFRWLYSIMSQKKLPTYESSLKEPRTKQVKERGTSWSCRGRLRCGLVRQSTYQHFVSFVFC